MITKSQFNLNSLSNSMNSKINRNAEGYSTIGVSQSDSFVNNNASAIKNVQNKSSKLNFGAAKKVFEFILLGAPNCGKGTIAGWLEKNFAVPSVSTGNALREEIKNGTELGLEAKSFMDQGKLVPDEVILPMMEKELKKYQNGFILDGFPRTVDQAKALDSALERINKDKNAEVVRIFTDVPEEELISRAINRRVCSKDQKHIFSLRENPQLKNCSECGGELIQRKDDQIDVVKDRLIEYQEKTHPVVLHYQNSNSLYTLQPPKQGEDKFTQIKALMQKISENIS